MTEDHCLGAGRVAAGLTASEACCLGGLRRAMFWAVRVIVSGCSSCLLGLFELFTRAVRVVYSGCSSCLLGLFEQNYRNHPI